MCFFVALFFFKIKIADILDFQWIKYLGKSLLNLTNRGIGVSCYWNHGLLKLLLHFIEYRLDQLNNKHTETAVNSTIQFFESSYQKSYLVKVWSFLVHPQSCKIFAKLNGNHFLMANIFKLHKYQTFGLLKRHNMSKI